MWSWQPFLSPHFFCFTEVCDIVFSLWGCHRPNERLQGLAFTSLSLSLVLLEHFSTLASLAVVHGAGVKFAETESAVCFPIQVFVSVSYLWKVIASGSALSAM